MPLSEKQKKSFEAFASRLGFQPNEHTSTLASEGFTRKTVPTTTTVLAADPSKTSVPHKLLSIGSIDVLKATIGASDHENDDHITYPESLQIAPGVRKRDLTPDQIHQLKRLAHAYIYGKSGKISDSDKALINDVMFPTMVAAYSEPDYTVKKGEVLEVHAGTVANYGILTVETGGRIVILGDASMNCQQFVQLS